MKEKTHIAKTLEVIGCRARYNAQAKKLFSNKTILAWILKYCTHEFADYSIEEIEVCIEGEPEISSISLYPGKKKVEAITGISEDDDVPNEGDITYDIRFCAYVPSLNERIKLFINLEIQNKYNPGYKLSKRGVFYCSRMLSSQLDTEFTVENYNDIKKVYSIWICSNSPKYACNTITRYEMAQHNLYGNFPLNTDTDLLSLVMVNLRISDYPLKERFHPLIELLTIILTPHLNADEKLRILETQFNIKTHNNVEGVITDMCNLADYYAEYGFKKGKKAGMEAG